MQYKGYHARVEFDGDAEVFHGEVVGIRDVVTFEGESVAELRTAFRESVDDYLDFCKQRGERPDKPYSGRFLVRINPDLHQRLSTAAELSGESLNAWIARQLEDDVNSCLADIASGWRKRRKDRTAKRKTTRTKSK